VGGSNLFLTKEGAMSIIAISRGTFSGGEALATRVAERLGYQCVSRETNLEAAAKEYGIPADELTADMEKRPSFWHRVIGERTAYLTFVRATLCERARRDNLVYHGLVGHLLLPGVAHVIRVRVIAERGARNQAAMQHQNIGNNEARAHIEKVDKERRQWIRFLFDVEWDDPQLYDVVLNLTRMSLDGACATVVGLTERVEFQPTAASQQAMQNLALSSRVSAVLARDPRTRDVDLKVTADNGVVTITGETRSPAVEEAVPVVVRELDGVKEVRYKIVFVPVYTPS
jgi:cytidylate kinase